jgi:hypothetical protein
MRLLIGLIVAAIGLTAVHAQEKDKAPPRRYGVVLNLRRYPQATPKETLASVLQAIDDRRLDYLLAHLVEPNFVEERVKKAGGNFDEVVKETRAKLADNSDVIKELNRFLKEGEWNTTETTASVSLKDVKDRMVFFRKIENRWYLENRQQPPKEREK